MSLYFIIDGYNLIKQTSVLNKIKLKDSRLALIRFLSVYRPQGSLNNQVTVVFDGESGDFYSRRIQNIEVIFSRSQSADEKIKMLIRKAHNPKNVVVVTNDREIRSYVCGCQGQIRTVEEFLAKFLGPENPKQDDDKPELSPYEAGKITDELKGIWLSKED